MYVISILHSSYNLFVISQNLKQQKLRREKFSAVPLSVSDFNAGQNGSVLRGGKLADPGASVALDMDGLEKQQAQMQLVDQQVL